MGPKRRAARRLAQSAVLCVVLGWLPQGLTAQSTSNEEASTATQETAQEPSVMPEPSFEPIEPIRDRGPVTNLPLPRFVSLKASEANVRRGPSLTHRIDWVFQRRNMPLEVTEEYENWRRVRDRDGAGGWVYHTLISGVRYALVTDAHIALRTRASEQAAAVADLEQNVVARILECSEDWCRLNADGYKGWVPKTAIWGVSDAEVID